MSPPRQLEDTSSSLHHSSTKSSSTGFHQRKISLTTACPPTGTRKPSITRHGTAFPHSNSSFGQLCRRFSRLRLVRLVGLAYIVISVVLSTMHLLTSFGDGSVPAAASVTDETTAQTAVMAPPPPPLLPPSSSSPNNNELSPLNDLSYQIRLSKMFSKSLVRMDHLRPYWFTATHTPAPNSLTLATVVTMDEWSALANLAETWQGSISAVLQVPTDGTDLGSGTMIQHLATIRRDFERNEYLSRHVDLHLIARPSRTDNGAQVVHSSLQDGRNLARLFSRSKYVANMPVTTLWMTDLTRAIDAYAHKLDQGDVLIVPTFGFPKSRFAVTDTWPTTKPEMVEWVDEKRMGMLDYHWRLNMGPTSYEAWRDATEPYLIPNYDFHYNPVFITTRENHPWCDERFSDEPSACLYSIYLNGADLWVLSQDYTVRTGQEPENMLTQEERIQQVKVYKNYRIEQCVFYARQFDQTGIFNTNRAKHVQEECAKELGNLRKEKMIETFH